MSYKIITVQVNDTGTGSQPNLLAAYDQLEKMVERAEADGYTPLGGHNVYTRQYPHGMMTIISQSISKPDGGEIKSAITFIHDKVRRWVPCHKTADGFLRDEADNIVVKAAEPVKSADPNQTTAPKTSDPVNPISGDISAKAVTDSSGKATYVGNSTASNDADKTPAKGQSSKQASTAR